MADDTTVSRFSKSALLRLVLCGSSSLALMTALPAYAQDVPPPGDTSVASEIDEEDDEVVATGIRQSLENAQAIKRNADTFVDAISSEDIGALPDRSVTEALQRVPGVTISRFAAADDPDHFSIEGSDVVVRGLTYVSSECNGRATFSANNGRALSFADVPPELLSGVNVFKNQTADLIEGGISGTISLKTLKPFDRPGRVLAGTAELNYTDFREEVAPNLSGLFSNRWETSAGEFGLRVNAVTSELKSRSDGSKISSFQPRDDLAAQRVWVPEGAVVQSQDYDRKRVGYGAAAQWANPDRTIEATAEWIRSEATTSWGEYVSEIATDNIGDNAFFGLPGTQFTFDEDDLFTSGSISAPVGWRSDQFSGNARTPIYGLQSNNIRRSVEQEYITSDYSFNVKLTPTDRWSFNLDYQHVDSTVENTDFTLWGSSFQDLRLDLRGGTIPDIEYLFPTNQTPGFNPNSGVDVDCSTGLGSRNCPTYGINEFDSLADPYNSFWRAAMDHIEDSEGTQDAFRADVEYDVSGDWIRSVRAGARFSDRDQTTRFSTYNWGALSEIWGNGGPIWMNDVGVPEGAVTNFAWDNFQRGEVSQPPSLPFYNGNPGQDYNQAADFADSVVRAWLAQGGNPLAAGATAPGGSGGWRRLGDREGVLPGTPFLPGEVADVVEQTTAFYGMVNFGNDDPFGNGVTLEGNIGLRYVETDIQSDGFVTFPQPSDLPDLNGAACVDTGNPPNPSFQPQEFCILPAAVQNAAIAFSDGNTVAQTTEFSYDNWLPSLNLKFGITDDKIIRFAYSRGISRADVGLLRNYYTLNAETADDPRTEESEAPPPGTSAGFYGFEGRGGNPRLLPVVADNYDLSFEWYFDDVGSLTFSTFYKEIENIIDNGDGLLTFSNGGTTYDDVYIVQPGNADAKGKVKGFEVAYQQFYDEILPAPFDGLGANITYTFLDTNEIPSSSVSPTSADPTANADQVLAEDQDLPLEGLSKHNFNLTGIYEKGRISTRLSYNWRSDYLLTERDVITPFYPIFQEASGQLDGSFFYTVNDNIKIGVQGANLLDTVTETTSLLPNSDGRRGFRAAFRNDRRFTFSLRANF